MPNPNQAIPETSQIPAAPSRPRWIKISVDDELFHHLHIVAAQSRMRLTPYLRRYLAAAQPHSHQSPARNNNL